jgi:hypothetical protein
VIGLLWFALAILASPFKSKLRLEAENAVLRHQLIVLRRRPHGRVQLTNRDRWFFVQLYRWFPSILKVLMVVIGAIVRADPVLPIRVQQQTFERQNGAVPSHRQVVCTENLIRVDAVMESPKLAE